MRRTLDSKVKGRPMWTWKKEVEVESVKVGLRMEDALCRSQWGVGVNQIAAGLRESGHPHLLGIQPDGKHRCICKSPFAQQPSINY